MSWKGAVRYLTGTHPRLRGGEEIQWCTVHSAPSYSDTECIERFTVWSTGVNPCNFVTAWIIYDKEAL